MGEQQNDEGRALADQVRQVRQVRLAAIGEIAAEVAHELRNSLQIISANVYLAKHDAALGALSTSAGGHLLKIERSARIAQGIVDDLMALARAEPTQAEPVAVASVILAAREDLPAGSERVTFQERIEPAALEVKAHPGLLSRCLHVLYENATHAGATQITTRAHLDASFGCVIEVTDDGSGVPKEVASTIFEPLVSARPGGTGLGLALAKRIAGAHGGRIVLVDSDVGATFRIELPSDDRSGGLVDAAVTLRAVSDADASAIASLEQAQDTKDFIVPYDVAQHVANLRDPALVYLAILQRARMVGFVILYLDPDARSVELRRIVVSAKERGVGQAAIKAVERRCLGPLGRQRVWLDVFEHNPRARHVYEKLDYVRFGETTHEGQTLLLYEKHLGESMTAPLPP